MSMHSMPKNVFFPLLCEKSSSTILFDIIYSFINLVVVVIFSSLRKGSKSMELAAHSLVFNFVFFLTFCFSSQLSL